MIIYSRQSNNWMKAVHAFELRHCSVCAYRQLSSRNLNARTRTTCVSYVIITEVKRVLRANKYYF